jgi:hypothetical protein
MAKRVPQQRTLNGICPALFRTVYAVNLPYELSGNYRSG